MQIKYIFKSAVTSACRPVYSLCGGGLFYNAADSSRIDASSRCQPINPSSMNPVTEAPSSKRPSCPVCLRAQQGCICRWITPTANAPEVLLLQHPMEVENAKNSAGLLHLSLERSRLMVGEVFDEDVLHAMLYGPSEQQRDASQGKGEAQAYPVLLYPETSDYQSLHMQPPPPLDQAAVSRPEKVRLVVLDGTWRKSRKMLYTNPLLQALPRLVLQDVPASKYLIRKAHGEHQLSTLEASCHALMHLERNDAKYQPLLEAFAGFVAQQMAYRERRAQS